MCPASREFGRGAHFFVRFASGGCRGGLGVDEQAVDLGATSLKALPARDDGVDAGHGRSSARVQWQETWVRSGKAVDGCQSLVADEARLRRGRLTRSAGRQERRWGRGG